MEMLKGIVMESKLSSTANCFSPTQGICSSNHCSALRPGPIEVQRKYRYVLHMKMVFSAQIKAKLQALQVPHVEAYFQDK